MSTYLVTGTSRGIGLEFVRQLLAAPADKVSAIVAVTRNANSAALNELVGQSRGRAVNIVIEDLADEKSIERSLPEIERALGGKGLDALINNAGTSDWQPDGISAVSSTGLIDLFRTNVATVQAVTSTLLPFLKSGKQKKVINISTTFGSIGLQEKFTWAPTPAYKVSKAAMNMLNKLYALEHKDAGLTFVLVAPGWCKTDLGSQNADLTPAEGVKAVLERADSVTVADTGKFFTVRVPGWEERYGAPYYDGSEQPW